MNKRVFWITAALLLIFDSVFLSVCSYFDFPHRWWLAVPGLVINLPATPLAILYSAVMEEPISKLEAVGAFGSEVIVSSLVWAWLVAKSAGPRNPVGAREHER